MSYTDEQVDVMNAELEAQRQLENKVKAILAAHVNAECLAIPADKLTPSLLLKLQTEVQKQRPGLCDFLISDALFDEIADDVELRLFWDKIPKLAEFEAGCLGFLLGLDVYTDRPLRENILPDRWIFVMSRDKTTGVGVKISEAQ